MAIQRRGDGRYVLEQRRDTLEIQGHEVEFTTDLPAPVWWELLPKLSMVEKGDKLIDKLSWPVVRQLLVAAIAEWDLDSDPGDPASYDSIGLMFAQELCVEAYNHVIQLFLSEQPGT